VWGMTRAAGRRAGAGTLLLAGIAVGIFCSSVILLLQTTNDFYNSFRLLRWLMGGLSAVDYGAVARLAPAALLGLIPALALTREMNLLLTGEDLAAARGVHVARVKGWLIGVTAVWIGGAVAACGPIGFLGLLTPHIMRRLVGADHRRLLPATLLGGGILLTVCDALARRIIAPAEMPVGAITALLGGPFFGLLLICDRAPGDAASS